MLGIKIPRLSPVSIFPWHSLFLDIHSHLRPSFQLPRPCLVPLWFLYASRTSRCYSVRRNHSRGQVSLMALGLVSNQFDLCSLTQRCLRSLSASFCSFTAWITGFSRMVGLMGYMLIGFGFCRRTAHWRIVWYYCESFRCKRGQSVVMDELLNRWRFKPGSFWMCCWVNSLEPLLIK